MVSGQRVLVVDGLAETETVLKAVFEPRGLRVDRVRGDLRRARPSAVDRPDVVVLHDGDAAAAPEADRWPGLPRVIIGRLDVPPSATVPDRASGDARRLASPFHYGELIGAIESLLTK